MTAGEGIILGVAVSLVAFGLYIAYGELRFQRGHRTPDENKQWIKRQVEKATASVAASFSDERSDMVEAIAEGLDGRPATGRVIELRLLLSNDLSGSSESIVSIKRWAEATDGRSKVTFRTSGDESPPQLVVVDRRSVVYFEGRADDGPTMTTIIKGSERKAKPFVKSFDEFWDLDGAASHN